MKKVKSTDYKQIPWGKVMKGYYSQKGDVGNAILDIKGKCL